MAKGLRKFLITLQSIQSYTILDKTIDISWLDEIDYLPFEEVLL